MIKSTDQKIDLILDEIASIKSTMVYCRVMIDYLVDVNYISDEYKEVKETLKALKLENPSI